MTRYINPVITGYDQFLVDYVAIIHNRDPNIDKRLVEHGMEHLHSLTPEHFSTAHIPPFTETYEGKQTREFAFVFQWNESTERFDILYSGFAVATRSAEFFETRFDRWPQLEADYAQLAKKGHTINFEDLKFEVFKRLCERNGTPEQGQIHKIWLRDADSKSGSRCWFRVSFFVEDDTPVIRYETYGVLELQPYSISDVRFERWLEFEAYAKNLIKPEFQFNFEELKAELIKACPTGADSSYSQSIWVGGDRTIFRRGYRFWFNFTNEDGIPKIRYTNYSFS